MHKNSITPQEQTELQVYAIRIKGQLHIEWEGHFTGMILTVEANGETLLTGPIVDQAALYGLLRRVRDLGMTLISVIPVEPINSDTAISQQ